MVRVSITKFTTALRHLVRIYREEVPRKVIDEFGLMAEAEMRAALLRRRRAVAPEGVHFSDSLKYYRWHRKESPGVIASTYPYRPNYPWRSRAKAVPAAIRAFAIEGRKGYSAPPGRGIAVVKPTGEMQIRRSVGPSADRPYIFPSLWRASASVPETARRSLERALREALR